MNCTPSELMILAACFACVNRRGLMAISTYLLCQWANKDVTPEPPVDPLTVDLEYYPILSTFDQGRALPDYRKARVNFQNYIAEFLASGGPSVIPGATFPPQPVPSMYAKCYFLTGDGKFTGAFVQYQLDSAAVAFDVSLPAYAPGSATIQLWQFLHVSGVAQSRFALISQAEIAAGWTTATATLVACTLANWETLFQARARELAFWHYNAAHWSSVASTLPVYIAGANGVAGHAFQATANHMVSQRVRADLLSTVSGTYELTVAIVVKFDQFGPGNPVFDIRGIAEILMQIALVPPGDGSLAVDLTNTTLNNDFGVPVEVAITALEITDGDWLLVAVRIDELTATYTLDVFNVNTGQQWTATQPGVSAMPIYSSLTLDNDLPLWHMEFQGDRDYGYQGLTDSDRLYLWKRHLSDAELLDVFALGLLWEPTY